MSKSLNPLSVQNETLTFLYKEILLAWETGLSKKNFNSLIGDFKTFCDENGIQTVQYRNRKELKKQYQSFNAKCKKKEGVFLYARSETKTKDLFRLLRNCVAHAHFKKRQFNKLSYLYFEHKHRKEVKFIGQIPETLFKDFVIAIKSTIKES